MKLYIITCANCDFEETVGNLDRAEQVRWRHYWKSGEDHSEENVFIDEYEHIRRVEKK
jgi:hypothetical protein